MDLTSLASNIEKKKNGIYYSKNTSEISYPEEGNDSCFQIESDSFWFSHRNKIIIDAIKSFSTNSLFFDIGGGNGYVTKGLIDAKINAVLVEPGVIGATNANKRGIPNIICSTLENAGFYESSIDSAGLFDVVEHIKDDITFLLGINKYIKPGGHLYITVPSYNLLWSNEDIDAGHFRRYTLKKIISSLNKAGFTICYSTYFFSILTIPIFLFRSLPSMLGLNKNSNDVDKHKKEHKNKHGVLNYLLNAVLYWEIKNISEKKKIPFGSSCFIVALKK